LFSSLFAALAVPALAEPVSPPVDVDVRPLPPVGDASGEAPATVTSPSMITPLTFSPATAVVEETPVDPLRSAMAAALEDAAGTLTGFAAKRREAAVESFYAARGNAPAWVDADGLSPRGKAVLARLEDADADGLAPFALGIPALPAGTSPDELAAFEVTLSRAVVAFAEEASAGRVAPSSVNGKFITRKPERIDPIEALDTVAGASDVTAALEDFNPPHEGFRRLKARLAEIRARPDTPAPVAIPDGKTLKPGMSDARVPLLRDRFGVAAPLDPLAAEVYDEAVVEAVRAFQAKKGLEDDGIVGRRTIAVLNGAAIDEEGEILANLEMWRWMPREFGADHVFVNIPEFTARVVRHGVTTHVTRVVVGTPTNQTPVFSDEMEYLVVNPYWHVPESIRMKEMLPEIQADPAGYFRRNGYEAVWNGQVIDPASVIWDENAVKFVAIRQPPSEANALGRIKFMFPNQHAVYMHDTPSRKLFQRDYRAYSHGCVRVDDPMEFARAILADEPNVSVETLEAMFGGEERRVDLTQHVKVHIAYFTAWIDGDGTLQLRDDLYGHSSKIKAAIGHGSASQ
jgi:murein L,D-transpeptidase YcbB/YkuD